MKADEYRKMAGVEDRMWYYRALHQHVVRSVQPRSQGTELKVLDAGCGTGGLLRRLNQAYPSWRLTGLDLSPLACELAREQNAAEVVQGAITALPFDDATFDVVVSCEVLCQVPDDGLAIREIHRCLKPRGVLMLNLPAYPWLFSYHDREVANIRRYTRSGVNALLVEAGFGVVSSTYWNMLPFPLALARRKFFPPAAPDSDVKLYPAPVEAIFNGMMGLEHGWLWAGGRMSFGSSVLTVARKLSHDSAF